MHGEKTLINKIIIQVSTVHDKYTLTLLGLVVQVTGTLINTCTYRPQKADQLRQNKEENGKKDSSPDSSPKHH